MNDAAERVREMLEAPIKRCLCAGYGAPPGPCAWHAAMHVAFRAALAAEREAGRREGLEEAAKHLDWEADSNDPGPEVTAYRSGCDRHAGRKLRRMAREVRALTQKPPAKEGA